MQLTTNCSQLDKNSSWLVRLTNRLFPCQLVSVANHFEGDNKRTTREVHSRVA